MESRAELEVLLRRAGINPDQETLDLVEPVYRGYRPQLEELHAAELEGDEVETAYGQPPQHA